MVLENADGIEVFYQKSGSCLDQGAGAQQFGAPRTPNFLIRRHRSFTQAMAAGVDNDNLSQGGLVDSLLINSSPAEFRKRRLTPAGRAYDEVVVGAAIIRRNNSSTPQLPPRIQLF